MTQPLALTFQLDADSRKLVEGLLFADTEIHAFARKEKRVLDDAADESGRSFGQRFRHSLSQGMTGALSGLTGILGGAGKMVFSTPTMFAGLIVGAGQAIAAIAPAVGVLNLIPAAAGAAALGLGTLIVAFHGMGDAIKSSGDPEKYAEALKNLAPSARETVRALVALKPALHAVRMEVQQTLFRDMGDQIKTLGGAYLPMLRDELGATAGVLNRIFASLTGTLASPRVFRSITESLNNMVMGLWKAGGAFSHLADAIGQVIRVGSDFLPGLGQGFTNVMTRFDAFITRISGDGTLHDWIQSGLDALKLLSPLLKDVWGILHPILQALNATNSGGLGFLGQLLHKLSEFLNSAQGMATLVAIFSVLNDVFSLFGDTLVALLPALGQLFASLGPPLVAILQALLPSFVELASALGPALTPLILALVPSIIELANSFADIINWITPFLPQLEKLAPVITILAQAISGLLVPALILWTINATAAAVANIAATWELLLIAAAVAALGYGIYQLVKHWSTVWNWIKHIAGNIGEFFAGVGHWFVDVWHHIVDAIKAGLDWVGQIPQRVMAALKALPGFLAHIAREALMRFAYMVGYGLGLVVKEFLALPGQVWHIITSLWNTAYALAVKGGNIVIDFFKKLPGRIGGFFHDLWTTSVRIWHAGVNAVVDFASKLPGRVWSFLQSLPGKVWDAVKGAGTWLYNTGKDLVQGLINGAKSLFANAIGMIKDFAHNMWSGFKDALGMHSPSKVFAEGGANIVAGLVKGIVDNAGSAHAAVNGLFGGLGSNMGPHGINTSGFNTGRRLAGVGGGGGAIEVHSHIYLDGKQLNTQLIRVAQRRKQRTGTTGLA